MSDGDSEELYVSTPDRVVGIGVMKNAEYLTTYKVEYLRKVIDILEQMEVDTVDVKVVEDHMKGDAPMLAFEPNRPQAYGTHGNAMVMAAPRVKPDVNVKEQPKPPEHRLDDAIKQVELAKGDIDQDAKVYGAPVRKILTEAANDMIRVRKFLEVNHDD